MAIADVDRTLPANRLVFELRRDMALLRRFRNDLEGVMEAYRLGAEEKEALRRQDIGRLAALGLHPYFLPQVARLFEGGAYNHNRSPAARLYARNMVPGAGAVERG